jgi:hypothetical protein
MIAYATSTGIIQVTSKPGLILKSYLPTDDFASILGGA